jgi:hypothetical protein
MLPHDRLLAWFRLEDEGEQLNEFHSVFTPDAKLDGELSPWDEVLPMLKVTASLRDVRPLVSEGNPANGVVVIEGRDPVTELWHRQAWAFSAQDGLISRVISTTSQGLPSPEARAVKSGPNYG